LSGELPQPIIRDPRVDFARRESIPPGFIASWIFSGKPRMRVRGTDLVSFLRCELQRHDPARNLGWLKEHEVRQRVGCLWIVASVGEASRASERRPALSRARIF
jgi:hypothetical protein